MPENGGNNSGLPDPFDHRPAPFSLQPWAMNSPADTPLGRGPRGPAPRKPAASSGWSDCEKHTSGTRTAAPSITHCSSLQASKIGLPPVALSKALRVAPPRMELVATRPTRFEAPPPRCSPAFTGGSQLAGRSRREDAIHRAGQPLGKRLQRELQRYAQKRATEARNFLRNTKLWA